ncbi:hypothetical protein [Marivirga sp.]|uniref:hypothetical protein n=1 Tax=Marivirga sp. TaxID=2018662 RepID=UPI00260089FA|nr:hypothetical protein [Marivirga sp.]
MSDHNIIPGIHNWCDRWCEKCSFIARCAVGIKELDIIEEEQKGNNPDFWEGIKEQFTNTIKLIDKLAKEKGIDLDGIHDEEWEQIEKENEQKRKEGMEHPITQIASKYLKSGLDTLDSGIIENKLNSEIEKFELGLEKEAHSGITQLKDAVDIIKWYIFFISAKCQRLVMENMDKEFEDTEFPPEERSYNGTAKITLISIERSITAWGVLLRLIPEYQDEILSKLVLLQKLQGLIEIEFPDAMRFIRPGFDE